MMNIRTRHILIGMTLPLWALLSACGSTTVSTDGGSGGNGGSGGSGGSAGNGGSTNPPVKLLGCDGIDISSAKTVDADIDADTTWSGVVLVSKNISVNGNATLTIEAGTEIVFDANSALEIGWNGSPSSISAKGTAADPIKFCGKSSGAGVWGGLTIGTAVKSDSVLANVLISGAGSADQALLVNSPITLEDVQIRDSGSAGVIASDFNAKSKGLSVDGAAKEAVVLSSSLAVGHFPLGGSFTNNTKNIVALRFSDIEEDEIFSNPGIPYLQEESVYISQGASVEMKAGVDYLFAADTLLDVGWNSNSSEFLVRGTEAEPVRFHGLVSADGGNASPGYWKGIQIGSGVLTTSVLEFVEISDAGALDTYALNIESPITLTDVSLMENSLGVNINDKGLKNTSARLSVSKTTDYPVTAHPEALYTLPEGGSYAGNTKDYIRVVSADLAGVGTVPKLDIPYYLEGIQMVTGAKLTLSQGTTFVMAPDALFEVGWNGNVVSFYAVGTADEPIVFKGMASTPGYWTGLVIGYKVTSDSKMEYVNVSDGGGSSYANLYFAEDGFTVSQCSFSNSSTAGISKSSGDTTNYTTNNTFSGNAHGAVVTR